MPVVNVTLLAFAAERRAAAPCCGATDAWRPAIALSIDISSAANPPHAGANDGTDRQTDGRTDRRSTVSSFQVSVAEWLARLTAV